MITTEDIKRIFKNAGIIKAEETSKSKTDISEEIVFKTVLEKNGQVNIRLTKENDEDMYYIETWQLSDGKQNTPTKKRILVINNIIPVETIQSQVDIRLSNIAEIAHEIDILYAAGTKVQEFIDKH